MNQCANCMKPLPAGALCCPSCGRLASSAVPSSAAWGISSLTGGGATGLRQLLRGQGVYQQPAAVPEPPSAAHDKSATEPLCFRLPDGTDPVGPLRSLPKLITALDPLHDTPIPAPAYTAEIILVSLPRRIETLLLLHPHRLGCDSQMQAAAASLGFVSAVGSVTASLLPAADDAHACFITRERSFHAFDGEILFFSLPSHPQAGIDLRRCVDLIRRNPGCALRVFITPAEDPAIRQTVLRGASMMPAGVSGTEALTGMASHAGQLLIFAVLQSPDAIQLHMTAHELRCLLDEGKLYSRIWEYTGERRSLSARLQSPGTLHELLTELIGGRLAVTALLYAQDELARVLSAPLRPACTPAAPTPAQPLQPHIPQKPLLLARFTQEELSALGVREASELLTLGATQQDIDLMCTALPQIRLQLETGMLPRNAPLAVGLCMAYESVIAGGYRRALYDQELLSYPLPENMRRNFELVNVEGYIPLGPETSRERIARYARHALLDGQTLDAQQWQVWFNCFTYVRRLRNRVHPSNPDVSRKDLRLLYELMLHPGSAPKLRALESAGENGFIKPSFVQSLSAAIRRSPLQYSDCLFRFLLRCTGARWRTDVP